MSTQLQVVNDHIQSLQPVFEQRLIDRSLNFQAEAGFALQILQQNDYALKIAATNRASLEAAITNVAAIGISLNPALKQAYLVPRKGGICLAISYMGVMHMAMLTGAIVWGQARTVRLSDTFELRGIDQEPIHTFNPFAPDRGPVVGAYVVVKLPNGDYLTHAMPIADVYAIRDRSDAWKAYKSKGNTCPWVTDEEEMIKKTVVHQAHKYWPHNERLDKTLHYLNTDGGEGLQPIQQDTPTDIARRARAQGDAEQRQALVAKLEQAAATHNLDTLRKEWEGMSKAERLMVGGEEWSRIKASVQDQNIQDVEA